MPSRFLKLLLPCLLAFAALAAAQDTPSPQDAPRIIARYKQMLAANPVDGVALDRLWKIYQDQSQTAQLLADYKTAADANDFASAEILGLLQRRAGDTAAASAAFHQAAALNPQSPQPHLALAQLLTDQSASADAATEYETAVGLLAADDKALPDVLFKLGSAWFVAGDKEKASAAWERIVAINPANIDLRQRLAENYAANNLPDKALAHYTYIAANGEAPQRVAALQGIARIQQAAGNVDAAIQSMETAITLTAPGNWLRVELQTQLIRQYQRSGRTDELAARWQKATTDNPRDTAAWLQLVELYERTGDPAQEAGAVKKLSDLLPGEIDYKTKLARLDFRLDHLDEASALYDEILKNRPADADIIFERAQIDAQRGAPKLARDRIEAFLLTTPGDAALTGRAVDFYTQHRMFDTVEDHLKSAATGDEASTLALAAFYYSQHRDPEARRALQSLVKPAGTPELQAAAHIKIAAVLREQKDTQGALDELQQAVQLQPQSRAARLAQGALLSGAGRFDEALPALEEAYELGKTDVEREEADTQLFQMFEMRAAHDRQDSPVKPTLRGNTLAAATPDTLSRYIDTLSAAATKNPSVDGWLRVARWLSWDRKNQPALQAALKAVALDPGSIPARGMAVKLCSPADAGVALAQLQELVKLNPAKQTAYLCQVGRLEWESGQNDQSIQLFTALEKSNPGDLDVLAGLATALERAGRRDEAIATLQRALDIAPATRKHEIAPALVRLLEGMKMHAKAVGVLSAVTDAQPDDTQRATAFQDLLAYGTRHDSLDWLQAQYEQKLRVNPDDDFARAALAKIYKANGRESDALRLLGDAAFTARDQVAALRELVAEAEAAGDFDIAILNQKRVALTAPPDDPTDLEKLAILQETNIDLDSASTTWDRIASGYFTDPAALSAASAYFLRWDMPEKARPLLRKASALEPANLQTLTTLAQLAANAGDNKEALTCSEKILQNSTPEKEGPILRIPGLDPVDDVATDWNYFSGFAVLDPRLDARTPLDIRHAWRQQGLDISGTAAPRFAAISGISAILRDSGDKPALDAWLARWRAPSATPDEALRAFYFSGAHDSALKLVDDLARAHPPGTDFAQARIWIALQSGEYAMLSRWITDPARNIQERTFFMSAIHALINGTRAGDGDPAYVKGLFPDSLKPSELMWNVAVEFAERGNYAQGIRLGERVFRASRSQRASYGLELAHWYIYAGDLDGASRTLRAAIDSDGDTGDREVFSAMREYYLLLPENERAAFIESRAASVKQNPAHLALSLAMLYGLQGDRDRAGEQISKLLALRPMSVMTDSSATPASRTWSFILGAGEQFQWWRLNNVAIDLWEKSLKDEAAIEIDGPEVADIVHEIRARLFIAKLTTANPVEASMLLDDYLRTATPEAARTVATLLEDGSFFAQNVKMYQRLLELTPRNRYLLDGLLDAARAANDFDAQKNALQQAAADAIQDGNGSYYQIAYELIDLLSEARHYRSAQRTVEQALLNFPYRRELMLQAADIYAARHEDRLAEKTLRSVLSSQPADQAIRGMLVNFLEATGQPATAIQVLARPGAPGAEENARLAGLYLKTGQTAKAEAAAWKVLQSPTCDLIPGLAAAFIAKGESRQAQKLLLVALARSRDPAVLFAAQSQLLDSLPADASSSLVRALTQPLRDFLPAGARLHPDTGDNPGIGAQFYDLQEKLAQKFHHEDTLQALYAADWKQGAGAIDAGVRLIRLQAQAGRADALRATCDLMFARCDFTPGAMAAIQSALEETAVVEKPPSLKKGGGACPCIPARRFTCPPSHPGARRSGPQSRCRTSPRKTRRPLRLQG